MLRDTQDLDDFRIGASDGPIGHVHDLFFDDVAWVVRYLVVETGGWLSNRKVLISPIAIENSDWDRKLLRVSLTRDQVRRSPNVDTQLPVSRQNELEILAHYGYPGYWEGAGLWGEGHFPRGLRPGVVAVGLPIEARVAAERGDARAGDRHLRSRNEVLRYRLQAADGRIGDVSTFLVDDETWALEHLVIGTGHLWTRRSAIVPVSAVARVSWAESAVTLVLSRDQIKEVHDHDQSSLPRDPDD